MPMTVRRRTSLDDLEAESVYVLREVAASFERPVLMYSVGKDSSVLLHLCRKAFAPAPVPFPVLHVDTTMKFPEMYAFRDRIAREMGLDLRVKINHEALAQGANVWDWGSYRWTQVMKTEALLAALQEGRHDAAIGGARRDEEMSRAKERFFSFRDKFMQWDPANQRPELWQLFNTLVNQGESIRVFPISNWTELDVWLYIRREQIEVVPLYFAAPRQVIEQDGNLVPVYDQTPLGPDDQVRTVSCRYRTLGCYPLSCAVPSEAATLDELLVEMIQEQRSERATRLIDRDREASMELKKREGYF